MPRQFSHLSSIEIRQIIVAHNNGVPKLRIAKEHGIDNSTVHYHIRKYESAFPEQPNVYSLIKTEMRQECQHPSMRCSCCGKLKDAILRDERRTIRELRSQLKPVVCKNEMEIIGELRRRLAVAHQRLEVAGLPVE